MGLAGNDPCVAAAAFDIHLLALTQVRVGRLRDRNEDAIGGANDDLLPGDRLLVALLHGVAQREGTCAGDWAEIARLCGYLPLALRAAGGTLDGVRAVLDARAR